ncbi:hypothetical protein GF322_00750 [Candidatus Dependentiae bacterium]|nr:hypothetical protein [Candidatus Dependentiae bacterium]
MFIFKTDFYIVNLFFELIIILTGLIIYKIYKNKIALTISTAFTLSIVSLITLTISNAKNFLLLSLLLQVISYLFIILIFLAQYKKIISSNKKNSGFKKILSNCLKIILICIAIFAFFSFVKIFKLALISNSIEIYNFLINFIFCLLVGVINYILYLDSKKELHCGLFLAYFFFATAHLLIFLAYLQPIDILILLMLLFGHILILISLISLIKTNIFIDIAHLLSNTKLQLSLIITSLFLLIWMFYFPSFQFNSNDPKPNILPIKPHASKELIIEVRTGLFIKNFSAFDILSNNFELNGIIWFEFNPHQISLDLIDKFSFEKGTIIKKSEPEVKIIHDKLLVRYKIRVHFKSDLNFQFFPLEDHNLYLVLTNTHLNPNEIVLTSYNTDLSSAKNISTADWQLINSETNYGYIKSLIDEDSPEKNTFYPAVCFNMYFEKIGIKNLLIIFIPLFAAFFLGLFSLIVSIDSIKSILSLSVGSFTSLVFNLSVIQKLTPQTSYFCLSDSIFTLIVVCIFLILLLNIIIVKKTPPKIFKTIIFVRSYIFLFFLIVILTSVYYLLY